MRLAIPVGLALAHGLTAPSTTTDTVITPTLAAIATTTETTLTAQT